MSCNQRYTLKVPWLQYRILVTIKYNNRMCTFTPKLSLITLQGEGVAFHSVGESNGATSHSLPKRSRLGECNSSHRTSLYPGYATPILYAGRIGIRTAYRTAFVKNYIKLYKNKRTKKLDEDQIKSNEM